MSETKDKRVRMPSRRVAGAFGLPAVKRDTLVLEAAAAKAEIKAEYQRRKYRNKKVMLDAFFCAKRNAEIWLNLSVDLLKVSSVDHESVIASRGYSLVIDGVSKRLETLQSCCDWLSGYCAGVTASRGLVRFSGETVQLGLVGEKMMGALNG